MGGRPGTSRSMGRWVWLVALVAATCLVAVPVMAESEGGHVRSDLLRSRLSAAAVTRYWALHPDEAPAAVRAGFREVEAAASCRASCHAPMEVAARRPSQSCSTGMLMDFRNGRNRFRYVGTILGLSSAPRMTIEDFSPLTGIRVAGTSRSTVARAVANEGLLPSFTVNGVTVPSEGDPVAVAGAGCRLYAANLAFSTEAFPPAVSGIAVYQTRPEIAASCPGGTDPSCWPTSSHRGLGRARSIPRQAVDGRRAQRFCGRSGLGHVLGLRPEQRKSSRSSSATSWPCVVTRLSRPAHSRCG